MIDKHRTTLAFSNLFCGRSSLFFQQGLPKQLFIRTLISVLLIAFSGLASAAVTLTVPGSNSTGNYDVSWSGGQQTTTLFENGTAVKTTQQAGTYNASGKLTGNYSYYVRDCMSWVGCVNTISSDIAVNISTVPNAISAVLASKSGVSVVLSWVPPMGSPTSYNIRRLDGGLSASTTATTYTDSTINLNTAYTYNVQACNSTGCSAAWTTSNAVTVPRVFSVTIPPTDNDGKFDILWSGGRTNVEIVETTFTPYKSLGKFSSPSGSFAVSGKLSGTYTYFLRDCLLQSMTLPSCTDTPTYRVVVEYPSAAGSVGETYDYDALGRLSKVRIDGVVKTVYVYDKAGNRTTVTE